ncbi:MAG: helix-turn-helix domain-containing protein [Spirochaetia bacterium]|nr:helix-turn-helix domain-containing protein [Spirochaetia bacterium]
MASEIKLPPISRYRPFGPLSPKKNIVLEPGDIHPRIRISHRMVGVLEIPERIILDYELVWIPFGEGTLFFGKKKIHFGKSSLLLIPPFVPHSFSSAGKRIEHMAIHFDWWRVGKTLPVLQSRKPYLVQIGKERDPETIRHSQVLPVHSQWLEKILQLRQSSDPFAELESASLLTQVLLTLLRKNPESKESSPFTPALTRRLQTALQYLETHFSETVTPTELVRESGLSLSHLNRSFRAWASLSPMEYLRTFRIAKSRDFLIRSDLSVGEIARRCGFDDIYHFSKTFRQLEGLPPTEYRERLSQKS